MNRRPMSFPPESSVFRALRPRRRTLLVAALLIGACCRFAAGFQSGPVNGQPPARAPETVLVTANGEPITEGDLQFLMLSRRVPKERRPALRKQFLEQLIDRRLMRAYLAKRNATPEKQEIDEQVKRIEELIRKSGDDPEVVLRKLGFDEQRLRAEIALPLAWQRHAGRIITDKQLRDHFAEHRPEFDGTEVRASQIFLKVDTEADSDALTAAEQKLKNIRQQVLDGTVSFADAAKRHSEAPSATGGGDVGFFPYRGKMPVEFSWAAFPLKPGEVSQPFRTRFGVHLLTVTDRRPGQLSLEDVRAVVYNAVARQVWDRLVAAERKQATIEWKIAPE